MCGFDAGVVCTAEGVFADAFVLIVDRATEVFEKSTELLFGKDEVVVGTGLGGKLCGGCDRNIFIAVSSGVGPVADTDESEVVVPLREGGGLYVGRVTGCRVDCGCDGCRFGLLGGGSSSSLSVKSMTSAAGRLTVDLGEIDERMAFEASWSEESFSVLTTGCFASEDSSDITMRSSLPLSDCDRFVGE